MTIIQPAEIATPQTFISQAINQGLPIEHLEKLMALQERWEANNARKLFFEALADFQFLCPTIEKKKLVSYTNSRNQTTAYKYAELAEIDQTIKEPMKNAGLSKRWEIEDTPQQLKVTAIISHVAGHSEQSSMSASKDDSGGKNDIQSRASAITYLQRYTLVAALGLSTASEDDDGQAQQEKSTTRTPAANPENTAQQTPTEPTVNGKQAHLPTDSEILKAANLSQLRMFWSLMPPEIQDKKTNLVKTAAKSLKLKLKQDAEELSIFDLIDQIKCIDTPEEMNKYLLRNQKYLDDNFQTDANVKAAFNEVQEYLKKKKTKKKEDK